MYCRWQDSVADLFLLHFIVFQSPTVVLNGCGQMKACETISCPFRKDRWQGYDFLLVSLNAFKLLHCTQKI